MICSSVNLVRFIVRPQVGPDSNRIWRKNPGAGQTSYDISLCPIFFETDGSGGFDRTSVLIHELAHFEIGAGGAAEDHCLLDDAAGCKKVASENPDRAVRSADNFRLFIEHAAQSEFGETLPFGD